MYLQYFNLKRFPFATTCEEKFFFESSVHAEALANMLYTVQQRKGMVLVTGEVGAGKTFLANMLGARLGVGCLTAAMKHPPQSGKQLLRGLAKGVGMTVSSTVDKMSLVEDLEDLLVRQHHRGRLVAMILDEAQDLSPNTLEELRLLWNWEVDGQRLLQIVIIGQPELHDRLRDPKWEPLRQRIVLSYHLGPLTAKDTAAYVVHRLRVAAEDGASVQFTPEALEEIYNATTGIPRLINVLCDNALLVAYAKGVQSIDRPIVSEVVRDMTCWNLRSAQ